ncbi:hypothetical protein AAG570_002854 [Ranatra chinensis]|uniref:Uncharacterized protein n=1 Tax=Ranatra chinensis TaxID=642074 RepID=A0ABD0Y527_9HEMI
MGSARYGGLGEFQVKERVEFFTKDLSECGDLESAMWYCYIVIGVLSTLVLFYWIVEFHYFLRMAVTAFAARFVKKKTNIMSTTQLTGDDPRSVVELEQKSVVKFSVLCMRDGYACVHEESVKRNCGMDVADPDLAGREQRELPRGSKPPIRDIPWKVNMRVRETTAQDEGANVSSVRVVSLSGGYRR